MSKRLNTIMGYYKPAFFHINVKTDNTFKNFSDKDFSIFIHEYVHFIQDVTTTYGLNNMYVYSEYIRYATNHAYNSRSEQIKTPIRPTPDNEDNVYLNQKICSLTNGDANSILRIIEIKEISEINEPTNVVGSMNDNIESIVLTIIDDKGDEHFTVFGALCLMENIAYLIEQYVSKDCIKSPDFPYSAAEKIVEKLHPEFGKNKLNILALCDISLLYSNPGRVFVHLLHEMKSEKWLPTIPENIYDNYLSAKTLINGLEEITLKDNYEHISSVVIAQLKGYFNDTIFDDLKDWIHFLVNTAKKIRFNDKYFLLNIAKDGYFRENDSLMKILGTLGTPLVSNSLGNCTMHYPGKVKGVELLYFLALGEIISVFENGINNCGIYNICEIYKYNVDNRCKTAPWERSQDSILCPFAMLWRHWKLKGYTPLIK